MKEMEGKEKMNVRIHLLGCPFAVADGLKLVRVGERVLAKAQVSETLTITRDLGFTTITQLGGMLAERGIKVLYGE